MALQPTSPRTPAERPALGAGDDVQAGQQQPASEQQQAQRQQAQQWGPAVLPARPAVIAHAALSQHAFWLASAGPPVCPCCCCCHCYLLPDAEPHRWDSSNILTGQLIDSQTDYGQGCSHDVDAGCIAEPSCRCCRNEELLSPHSVRHKQGVPGASPLRHPDLPWSPTGQPQATPTRASKRQASRCHPASLLCRGPCATCELAVQCSAAEAP